MVNIALDENRIILTRDTHIPERSLITSGKVRAILIKSDNIEEQIKQLIDELNLIRQGKPFSLCLECNQPLVPRSKEEIKDRVPPYVFQTRQEYMECPACRRVYWKGTHWEAMTDRLKKLAEYKDKNKHE